MTLCTLHSTTYDSWGGQAECPGCRNDEPHDHWHPHGHLFCDDCEAAAND